MSWSSGREPSRDVTALREKKQQSLSRIEGLLASLAKNEDLQDDLTDPTVQAALSHWTNVTRLPPDDAEKLSDHRRAMYVFSRLQLFQQTCREESVPMSIPLFDHFRLGKGSLDAAFTQSFLGEYTQMEQTPVASSASVPATAPATKVSSRAVVAEEEEEYPTTIWTWGKEPMNHKNYSIGKVFVRALIEAVVSLVISVALAKIFVPDFDLLGAFNRKVGDESDTIADVEKEIEEF